MADFEKSTVPNLSLLLESLVRGGTRLVVQDLGIVRTTKAKPFFVCHIRRILLSRHGSSRRDTNPAFSRRVSRSARMFEAIRSSDRVSNSRK
jgi:hypothetical protein